MSGFERMNSKEAVYSSLNAFESSMGDVNPVFFRPAGILFKEIDLKGDKVRLLRENCREGMTVE